MTEEARLSWWQSRLDRLAREIEAGDYFVPAEEVAAAILFGRPKWGENPEATEDDSTTSSSRWSVGTH
jgi:predicted transcriptional regulator